MTNTDAIPAGMSASDWARRNGDHFTWTYAADNYEPTRTYRNGDGWHYPARHGGGRAIVLEIDALDDTDRLDVNGFYLYDDGRVVRAYYVAGYPPEAANARYVILHEMPTNYDENGDRRMRPDGRPVDHSLGWMGPRKAYHLKATTDDDRLAYLEERAAEATQHVEAYRAQHPHADLTTAVNQARSHVDAWEAFRDEVYARRSESGRWPSLTCKRCERGARSPIPCCQYVHHHDGDMCLHCGNDERVTDA